MYEVSFMSYVWSLKFLRVSNNPSVQTIWKPPSQYICACFSYISWRQYYEWTRNYWVSAGVLAPQVTAEALLMEPEHMDGAISLQHLFWSKTSRGDGDDWSVRVHACLLYVGENAEVNQSRTQSHSAVSKTYEVIWDHLKIFHWDIPDLMLKCWTMLFPTLFGTLHNSLCLFSL